MKYINILTICLYIILLVLPHNASAKLVNQKIIDTKYPSKYNLSPNRILRTFIVIDNKQTNKKELLCIQESVIEDLAKYNYMNANISVYKIDGILKGNENSNADYSSTIKNNFLQYNKQCTSYEPLFETDNLYYPDIHPDSSKVEETTNTLYKLKQMRAAKYMNNLEYLNKVSSLISLTDKSVVIKIGNIGHPVAVYGDYMIKENKGLRKLINYDDFNQMLKDMNSGDSNRIRKYIFRPTLGYTVLDTDRTNIVYIASNYIKKNKNSFSVNNYKSSVIRK